MLLSVLSFSAFAGCKPVDGDKIRGRDLALADPHLISLPANLTFAFAPDPGAQRVVTAVEIRRIAAFNGIHIDSLSDLCFEVPLRKIGLDEAIVAMRGSLPAIKDLNVLGLATVGVPPGVLEFPVTGIEPASPDGAGGQLWRGFVRYAENRRASVWARVVVTVTYSAVVAVRDLEPWAEIPRDAVRVESVQGPIWREQPLSRTEDIGGRGVRTPLKAGAVIFASLLSEVPVVRRGETVHVEVCSGLARLHFDAVAEGSARKGDVVELRNPLNGKSFRARLGFGSKAVLVLSSGQRL